MQSQTLKLNKTNVVRAGAGAGKTRNLSLRVLDWVESFIETHDRYPKIVVTTFTVKATQELKERLLLFAAERGNPKLIDYVRSGAYLQISTIHGVLSSLLRKYGHVLGLDAGFEVVSSMESSKTSKAKLRDILNNDGSYSLLLENYSYAELSDYLESYYENHLLGKSQSPVTGSDIEEYLLESFSIIQNKLDRVYEVLSRDLALIDKPSKTSENFTKLASCIKNIASLKVESLEHLAKRLNQEQSTVSRFPTNPSKNPVILVTTKDAVKEAWDELKKFSEKLETNSQHLQDYEQVNTVFASLANKWLETRLQDKIRNSKISMSDIELLSSLLMAQHPKLAYSFAEEYDYWLIDEFQDTSPEQLSILRRLIDDRPYYIVGDPQQSIYFFRGADQGLFIKEEDRILEQGGGRQILMKNYRTKPSTMSFINEFMGQFGFQEMETREVLELSPENIAAELLISEDSVSEVDQVGAKITRLLESGVAPSDICVLSRTKKKLIELSTYLHQKDCPYYLHSSGGFYDRREVLDLLFILKFLVHPFDRANLVGLFRSPWFYVEDELLFSFAESKDLWRAMRETQPNHPSVLRLIELKKYSDEYGILSALEKVIHQSGMLEVSRHYDPSGKREANIWKFLCQMREEEHKAFFSPLKVLRKAEEFSGSASEGELEAAAALEPNRIQLMTIHASKGLEFSHVFVLGMSSKPNLSKTLSYFYASGKFSLPVAIGEEGVKRLPPMVDPQLESIRVKELEESKRLMYVALTRAEEKLYLSFQKEIKKDSWLDGLQWDLSEGLHEKENYSYKVIYEVEEASFSRAASLKQTAKGLWTSDLNSEFKPLETDSVSKLLEQRTEYGRQVKKGDENEFYSAEHFEGRMKKAARGTSLHLILEQYAAAVKLGKRYSPPEGFEYALDYIDYLSSEPSFPFEELLIEPNMEWGFVMRHKGVSIEGQVDFWAEDGEANIWVIDYKTGSSRYSAKAMDQLKIYGLALSKFKPGKNIFIVTAFVEEKKSFVEKFDPSDSLFDQWGS